MIVKRALLFEDLVDFLIFLVGNPKAAAPPLFLNRRIEGRVSIHRAGRISSALSLIRPSVHFLIKRTIFTKKIPPQHVNNFVPHVTPYLNISFCFSPVAGSTV